MSPDEKSDKGDEKKAAKGDKKAEPKAGEEAPKEEEKARFRKGKKGGADKADKDEEKEKKGAPGVKLSGKVQVDRYIVRLVGTDLAGDRPVRMALLGIKGVGPRIAHYLVREAKLDPKAYIGNITAEEQARLDKAISALPEKAPEFLLNRRNDWESGADGHLLGQDVEVRRMDDINLMKKIRSYRGVRHEAGLPVRGQSTRHNGRVGLVMGVIRAKAVAAAAEGGGEKEEKKPAPAAKK